MERPVERARGGERFVELVLRAADPDSLARSEAVELDDARRFGGGRAFARSERRRRPSHLSQTPSSPRCGRRRRSAQTRRYLGAEGRRRARPRAAPRGRRRRGRRGARARARRAQPDRRRARDGTSRVRRCPGCPAPHGGRSRWRCARATRRGHALFRLIRLRAPAQSRSYATLRRWTRRPTRPSASMSSGSPAARASAIASRSKSRSRSGSGASRSRSRCARPATTRSSRSASVSRKGCARRRHASPTISRRTPSTSTRRASIPSGCGGASTRRRRAASAGRERSRPSPSRRRVSSRSCASRSRVVASLPDRLREAQAAFAATGGLHATGLFTAGGELVCAREDVGRHNAMDKVIGRAFLDGLLPLARARPLRERTAVVRARPEGCGRRLSDPRRRRRAVEPRRRARRRSRHHALRLRPRRRGERLHRAVAHRPVTGILLVGWSEQPVRLAEGARASTTARRSATAPGGCSARRATSGSRVGPGGLADPGTGPVAAIAVRAAGGFARDRRRDPSRHAAAHCRRVARARQPRAAMRQSRKTARCRARSRAVRSRPSRRRSGGCARCSPASTRRRSSSTQHFSST